jgi:hypothetical protein
MQAVLSPNHHYPSGIFVGLAKVCKSLNDLGMDVTLTFLDVKWPLIKQ